MRKIISKEEEDKKKKRNQLIVGGGLILIMFLSILGYSTMKDKKENNEKIIYNGIEFIKESGLWNAKIGDFQFSFRYNPNEAENIDSALNQLDNYRNKPLYIYSEDTDSEIEIYRNLFYYNRIAERVQNACLEEDREKCEESSPIKTCEDNFIIIRESENTEIKQQDNCVFIEGKKEDLIKLSDSFLFKITGVQ